MELFPLDMKKYVAAGGPDGGDGGKGGDIFYGRPRCKYFNRLLDIKKNLKQKMVIMEKVPVDLEKSGEDLLYKSTNRNNKKDAKTGRVQQTYQKKGQKALILHGGRGGKGNSNFATATRQAPRFAQDGEDGEEKN